MSILAKYNAAMEAKDEAAMNGICVFMGLLLVE